MSVQEYRPDPVWAQNMVNRIVSVSKIPPDQIKEVLINCGNGGGLGWVIKKTGEKVKV